MASFITAGNATNGLQVSSDNTGILELKSGTGSGTTAVTIGTGQQVAMTLGSAAAPSITFSGDTNTGIFSPAADTIAFGTNGTEDMRIDSSGNVLVTGGGGLGYGTGSGGTVTQATSKTTAVTLNKPTGQITMNGAALAGNTNVQFVVNNSLVSSSDVVLLTMNDANGPNYQVQAYVYGAGTFTINLRNITGGSLSNALVLNFAVIKGATA